MFSESVMIRASSISCDSRGILVPLLHVDYTLACRDWRFPATRHAVASLTLATALGDWARPNLINTLAREALCDSEKRRFLIGWSSW
jgi:hypothetical protein